MRRRRNKKHVFTTNDGEQVELSSKEELEFMEAISEDLGMWMQFFSRMGVDLTRVPILDFYAEIAKVLEYAQDPEPGKKMSVVHDKELGYFALDIVPIYPGLLLN